MWQTSPQAKVTRFFLEISEVGRYLGDKYDQIQPGFYEN